MIRIVSPALIITASLIGVSPAAQAQPILKRVEEMLRNQLGDPRPAADATDRGYLGMIGDDTPENAGVAVLEVYPGQPAAQGGLAAGDVITAVDGRQVRTMDDLVSMALDKPVGTKLALTVSRGGDTRKLAVTLGRKPAEPGTLTNELPPPAAMPNLIPPSGPRLGVRSVAVTPDVQQQHNLAEATGAHVIYVAPDSPAAKANVPLGAVITAVDRHPIRSPEELASVIRSSSNPTVELTYVHAGRTQRVTAEVGSATDAPPALVETQARKAQAPPSDGPPSAVPPATPPPPQPDPPAGSPLPDRWELLLDRIEALERRIEAIEARQKSP